MASTTPSEPPSKPPSEPPSEPPHGVDRSTQRPLIGPNGLNAKQEAYLWGAVNLGGGSYHYSTGEDGRDTYDPDDPELVGLEEWYGNQWGGQHNAANQG